MTATDPDQDDARDYEAIAEARDEARGERWLERMDRRYGTVEAWRAPKREATA